MWAQMYHTHHEDANKRVEVTQGLCYNQRKNNPCRSESCQMWWM